LKTIEHVEGLSDDDDNGDLWPHAQPRAIQRRGRPVEDDDAGEPNAKRRRADAGPGRIELLLRADRESGAAGEPLAMNGLDGLDGLG
jgi:hypothetical protein